MYRCLPCASSAAWSSFPARSSIGCRASRQKGTSLEPSLPPSLGPNAQPISLPFLLPPGIYRRYRVFPDQGKSSQRINGRRDGTQSHLPIYLHPFSQALGVPAVLLNALAVGALRGFLDTTTPLFVVTAAFLLVRRPRGKWRDEGLGSTSQFLTKHRFHPSNASSTGLHPPARVGTLAPPIKVYVLTSSFLPSTIIHSLKHFLHPSFLPFSPN